MQKSRSNFVCIHKLYFRKKNVEFQSCKQPSNYALDLSRKIECSVQSSLLSSRYFLYEKNGISILEVELLPLFLILRSEIIFFPAMKSCKKNIFISFLTFSLVELSESYITTSYFVLQKNIILFFFVCTCNFI